MAINQISTANTFQQWLVATQDLVGVANNLTDGIGGTFYANTNFVVGGNFSATGNVTAISSNITNLTAATANVTNLTGAANTGIYNTIATLSDSSIAFAIALG